MPKHLHSAFEAALEAVDPLRLVPQALPSAPKGRILVVGAGKAAASMAYAVEQHYGAEVNMGGHVITRYGHGLETQRITVHEAGHPIPDDAGEQAARLILEEVKSLTADDLLLCLVSGGGSSLLFVPVESVPMAEAKQLIARLLRSGAPIESINVIRKHLSQTQGGWLATHCLAPITSLIISDVTGDEATHIASGPTVPDPTTYAQALDLLSYYKVVPGPSARAHLEAGARGEINETPKADHPRFQQKNLTPIMIATAQQALSAAHTYLQGAGYQVLNLGDRITGDAKHVAQAMAGIALSAQADHTPMAPPLAIISGGETTVHVQGDGRGGRNVEFLLSLMNSLEGAPGISALACDTDGIDGIEEIAGAWITPESWQKAQALKLDPRASLRHNDAHTFFEAMGQQVITGPTRTNVNDFRVILVDSR